MSCSQVQAQGGGGEARNSAAGGDLVGCWPSTCCKLGCKLAVKRVWRVAPAAPRGGTAVQTLIRRCGSTCAARDRHSKRSASAELCRRSPGELGAG